MSTNVPVSQWRQSSGNGEFATLSELLTTLSGNQLITLGGTAIAALDGSFTNIPATAWAVVETVPVSQWQQSDGESEFSNRTPVNIADPSANLLVDPSGVFIVDTGVIETMIPANTWSEDDGK